MKDEFYINELIRISLNIFANENSIAKVKSIYVLFLQSLTRMDVG